MITPEIKKTLVLELTASIKAIADPTEDTYYLDSEYGEIIAKAFVSQEIEKQGDGIDTEITYEDTITVDYVKIELYTENGIINLN